MQILLDGKDVAADPKGTIDDLSREILEAVTSCGRTITHWRLFPPDAETVDGAALLEIRTTDSPELATRIYSLLLQFLPDHTRSHTLIAQAVENGVDASDDLAALARDWGSLLEAADALKMVDDTIDLPVSGTVESLGLLADAIEGNGDLTDSLGRLVMACEEWVEVLATFAESSPE